MGWIGSFRRVWAATALSNLGDGLLVVALPLLIIQFTRDPLVVAGVAAAAQAPYLLVSLFAGALADRHDRRLLLLSVTGLATIVLLVAAFVGAVDATTAVIALYVTAFLIGTCQTVSNSAFPALLPSIVPRTRLEWANSRIFGTKSTFNEFLGPPLAGLLVTLGVALALGTIAAAYAGSALLLLTLRDTFQPEQQPKAVLTDIGEGLRFLWHHQVLRTLTLMVAVMAGCWAAWEAVLVLHIVSPGPVGLTGLGYGTLITLLAAGGVTGALAADRMRRRFGRRSVLLADLAAAVIMIGSPALTSSPYILGGCLFVGGFGSGMWNVTAASLRQALTPDHLRGRVSATGVLFGWGPLPAGALLGGVLANAYGTQVVFAGGAILIAALSLPAARALTTAAVAIAESEATAQHTAVDRSGKDLEDKPRDS